jgi:hypothetical protein
MTSGRFWPTPTAMDNRKSRTALHGTGTRKGRGENYLHSSPPGLEQAVELSAGLLPKEYDDESQLTPSALTFSPEASLASPGPPPENNKAREMTAISGLNCIDLWFPSDRAGDFLRTCLGSLAWRVALTGYSLTWVRAATPQGRSLYRLRLSAPTTAGIGSGSSRVMFPTITCTDATMTAEAKAGQKGQHSVQLSHLANSGRLLHDNWHELPVPETQASRKKLWPTPRTEGFDAGSHRGNPDSLHSAVKMLPTAAASDYKGSSQEGQRRGQLSEVVAGMKLSAAWVGRLMMYPDGWMSDLPPDPLAKGK